MPIALDDLVAALELFVVVVVDAQRLADLVDAILIRRRVVAARRFVADGVGVLPVRVDVAGRQGWAGLGVLGQLVLELFAAGTGRRDQAVVGLPLGALGFRKDAPGAIERRFGGRTRTTVFDQCGRLGRGGLWRRRRRRTWSGFGGDGTTSDRASSGASRRLPGRPRRATSLGGLGGASGLRAPGSLRSRFARLGTGRGAAGRGLSRRAGGLRAGTSRRTSSGFLGSHDLSLQPG
jgi:hypothetical protein